jgi:hypothetical protein
MIMASILDGPNVRSGAADEYVGMMGEAMPEEDYAGLADLLGIPEASQALDDEYYDFDKAPYSELDDFEAQNAGQFVPEEGKGIGELLQKLSGGVVNFGKDILGRQIASQALGGAGRMIFGLPGALAGLTFGALKGGDLFNRNPVIADIAQAGNPFGLNMRRDAARISNMLQRGAAGKGFSQTNLDNLLGKFGITGVDTGSMMESIDQSAKTGYGGYGSSDAAAAAAASGGRDYSSSPGAMAGDMEYDEE